MPSSRSFSMTVLCSVAWLASGVLPAAVAAQCLGDCDGSGDVTVDEIVRGVNIALGAEVIESCEAFDADGSGDVTVDEIITVVNNALEGCPGDEGLGVRRFSLDPSSSKFEILGLPLSLQSSSFTGTMDLEAGPEGSNGIRPLKLVGISDYFAIQLRPPVGNPIIICLRPLVEALPVEGIGELACHGFDRAGIGLTQDHNTNDVDPSCAVGTLDQNPAHPGVCNGPLLPEILPGDSGPGTVAISPDPDTLEGGLQFEVLQESALPCGDEAAQGFAAPFLLSTGTSAATILDRNNTPGLTLDAERTGESFDCTDWTAEDGPGRLVFIAPILDFNTGVLGRVDILSVFSLDD